MERLMGTAQPALEHALTLVLLGYAFHQKTEGVESPGCGLWINRFCNENIRLTLLFIFIRHSQASKFLDFLINGRSG
jgi:hypothetical protein